jgi:dienelactone hydrolase
MTAYEGMVAETLAINGNKNEPISAYVARPLGPGPFPGIVLIHHAPGWDEWYRETTRKLWGGRVVISKDELTEKQPVAPIEFYEQLSCPLLGLFGYEDRASSPEQVNQHEAELKKYSKGFEFHRYDGAGHGFFYYDRPMYCVEQALDGWKKVFAFLQKHLAV